MVTFCITTIFLIFFYYFYLKKKLINKNNHYKCMYILFDPIDDSKYKPPLLFDSDGGILNLIQNDIQINFYSISIQSKTMLKAFSEPFFDAIRILNFFFSFVMNEKRTDFFFS